MRQAVLLIHGIGEQTPMASLRGFVDAVAVGFDGETPSTVYSKPDRMSETLELRRLVAAQSRTRPITDFFEFYWAHQMEGTKLRHLWPWFRTILFRRPDAVPSSLRVLWLLSWTLLIASLALFVTAKLSGSGDLSSKGPIVSLGLAALFTVIQGFAIRTLGDAARYLSPTPSNIAVRQRIRTQGVQLLRRLHKSGRYDRIIVVGHSLGSVIGYDVLTHFWDECTLPTVLPDAPRMRAIEKVEKAGRTVVSSKGGEPLNEFHSTQHDLWTEQRSLEFPWLVTDFVTLGSPLAHASLLLAAGSRDLAKRQSQRELPMCPPVEDADGYSYNHQYRFNGSPRSIRRLHHAAMFAVTRWSNLYFPNRFGLFGDWVGGPMADVMGRGVDDIAITAGRFRFLPLLPHIMYWRGTAGRSGEGKVHAVAALRCALRLDFASWARPTTASAELASASAKQVQAQVPVSAVGTAQAQALDSVSVPPTANARMIEENPVDRVT